MLQAHVKIKGVKPILFNRFNIEKITDTSRIKSGTKGSDTEEWRQSFFDQDGKLYMPDSYIQACLKNGSVYTKVGRGTLKKTWISAVNIMDEKIFLNRSMPKDWEEISTKDFPMDTSVPVFLDIRMVVNPNTKGRNIRYRIGCSTGWECSFNLLIDNTLLSKDQASKVIEDAGRLEGLADGRTLGYGRYEILEIKYKKVQ